MPSCGAENIFTVSASMDIAMASKSGGGARTPGGAIPHTSLALSQWM